jgi:hypothetical protein
VNREPAELTLVDVETACGWKRLQLDGLAPLDTNPLEVTGLRFSRLFPRQLLWRHEDGKVVVVDLVQATTLVHETLERRRLQERLPSWSEH